MSNCLDAKACGDRAIDSTAQSNDYAFCHRTIEDLLDEVDDLVSCLARFDLKSAFYFVTVSHESGLLGHRFVWPLSEPLITLIARNATPMGSRTIAGTATGFGLPKIFLALSVSTL